MPQGKIKKVIADKGFGFIEGQRGDLFFHQTAVEGTSFGALRVGQAVTYEEGRGPKRASRRESQTGVTPWIIEGTFRDQYRREQSVANGRRGRSPTGVRAIRRGVEREHRQGS